MPTVEASEVIAHGIQIVDVAPFFDFGAGTSPQYKALHVESLGREIDVLRDLL